MTTLNTTTPSFAKSLATIMAFAAVFALVMFWGNKLLLDGYFDLRNSHALVGCAMFAFGKELGYSLFNRPIQAFFLATSGLSVAAIILFSLMTSHA